MQNKFAFQDYYKDGDDICYGCGKNNEYGLKIKSYWDDDQTICKFVPKSHHTGPTGYVYGGLIASLVDCHGTATAAAATYKAENRAMGSLPDVRFVTASLHVDFKKPTPVDKEIELRGQIKEMKGKKVVIIINVISDGNITADGEVVAIRKG